MTDKGAIRIYYDGECPFCTRYVRYLRLRQSVNNAELLDLRRDPEQRARFRELGFDPDKGMIVEYGDRTYGGAEAMNILTGLSTPAGWLNRLTAILMRAPLSARLFYPFLRAGRALILLFLGRSGLDADTGVAKSPYGFFLFVFGAFGFFHLLNNVYEYGEPLYASTWLVGLSGLGLAFFPLSRRLFLLLTLALLVDGVLHAPVLSNHTIIKNFLVVGIALSGLASWFRGNSWTSFVHGFAPLGRWLLLIMYVFGIFHKINADFLNPESSCAVALWREIPLPSFLHESLVMHWMGIYGTFLVEGLILICLLVPRTREWGIMLGIGFHALLAISGYAMYVSFSTLSIALHCLFLPPYAHTRLEERPEVLRRIRSARRLPGLLVILAYITLIWLLAWNASYSQLGIVWCVLPVTLLWLVHQCVSGHSGDMIRSSRMLGTGPLLAILVAAFFLNCFAPYLGLKTAQSINMFANLRLEGSVSNHLVLRNPPGPFGYLGDIVEIESSSGVPYFVSIENRDLHLTYYSMLNYMERASNSATVTYVRDGKRYENVTRAELVPEFERVLHPRWFRAWFHFSPVDLTRPKPCALDR